MFNLSTEQKRLLAWARKFGEEVIAPRAAETDLKQEFPMDVKEKMADQGFFRVVIPKSYGGMELNLTDLCLVTEEIGRFDASMAVTFQSHTTSLRPILLTGSKALKDEIFPQVVKKNKVIGFAITEANAGSDSGAIQTSAVLRNGNYLLNGTKIYITNGSIADYILCSAVTSPERGHKGISIFLVDAASRGFSVGKKESKMGLRASPTTEIVFDNVVVPASKMVGNEGGFPVLMKALEAQRVTIGAQALGVAVGAFECAIQFAKEKIHFGKPLIEQQGIQFMLADMAMQVETARAFIYKVTEMYEQKFQPISAYASISKCFPSDVAMRVTTDAVQLMGSYGYMKQYPVERMMRDAKVTQIYEGTNQIQRLLIGRAIQKSEYSSVYSLE
jgi:alkylation response protein AidB-like acyl-CoA dehydrogenase